MVKLRSVKVCSFYLGRKLPFLFRILEWNSLYDKIERMINLLCVRFIRNANSNSHRQHTQLVVESNLKYLHTAFTLF